MLAAVTGVLLVLCASASQAPARTHGVHAGGGGPSTYDPLVFEQPTMPRLPRGSPSTRQLEQVLSFLADTYTYAARTGFESPLLEVVRSPGLSVIEEDVARLTAGGLHAEMEPVELQVIGQSEVWRLGRGRWCGSFRIELHRGPAVLADLRGDDVDHVAQRRFTFDVSVCTYRGWGYIFDIAPAVAAA